MCVCVSVCVGYTHFLTLTTVHLISSVYVFGGLHTCHPLTFCALAGCIFTRTLPLPLTHTYTQTHTALPSMCLTESESGGFTSSSSSWTGKYYQYSRYLQISPKSSFCWIPVLSSPVRVEGGGVCGGDGATVTGAMRLMLLAWSCYFLLASCRVGINGKLLRRMEDGKQAGVEGLRVCVQRSEGVCTR